MDSNCMYWMNYSIEISKEVSRSILRVGAILVSHNNELVCSAFNGEECNVSWYSVLLNKIRNLRIFNAQSIYVTINTLTEAHSFDLVELLKEVRIDEIYVGLPDPALTDYLAGDPVLKLNHIHRYPDELQRKIIKLNSCFFAESKQSIKHSPYYFENRISDLVIESLQSKGLDVCKDELNANKQKSALAYLIGRKYGIEYSEALYTVHTAISEAFNIKYGGYNYSNDTRSLNLDWKENFMSLYRSTSLKPISDINVLNVGVGSGHEAIALFSNCTSITFVDISQCGLEKIKEQIPSSKIIVSSADDLSSISDNSHELYVSLRTYNSSFFSIKEAVSEAYRTLKSNAVIIISVANGFLCPEQHCIIPGLILPGTEFVDIYRGMDITKKIHTEFIHAGFINIQSLPTKTEIYLSAIAA